MLLKNNLVIPLWVTRKELTMHPNPAFRKTEKEKNIEFARQHSFGILSVNADIGPLLSHIPFQLSKDGNFLEAHLVRSNPIVRQLENPLKAVLAVSGPDGYISPDWYDVENQVPTWNYVAVHLRGTLARLADSELHGVLSRLSANMENRLLPKKPWVSDKMDQEIYRKMQRQIVPVKMEVTDIQGTWKLGQNKTEEVRLRAADGVETSSLSNSAQILAELMRKATDE